MVTTYPDNHGGSVDYGSFLDILEDDASFFSPPNNLRQKVGTGGLPATIIRRAEEVVADNKIDFTPYAQAYLVMTEKALQKARDDRMRTRIHINALLRPLMQIKANCAMFGYPLLTEVAAIAQSFLDNIASLDDDALDVIDAHVKTIQIILQHELRGDGGRQGENLMNELDSVCERYYKRRNIQPVF